MDRDWYENNRDAIQTEDWIRQEWREELEWHREQIAIETDETKLAKYRETIKNLEKALGEYKGEKKY